MTFLKVFLLGSFVLLHLVFSTSCSTKKHIKTKKDVKQVKYTSKNDKIVYSNDDMNSNYLNTETFYLQEVDNLRYFQKLHTPQTSIYYFLYITHQFHLDFKQMYKNFSMLSYDTLKD